MSKRRAYNKRSKSSCPDPINGLIDLLGAATMGAVAKHKLMKDYQRGQGVESAEAAMMVFGAGSLRRGSTGTVNLGGLMGIGQALKEIEKMELSKSSGYPTIELPADFSDVRIDITKPETVRKYAWRDYCEDGLPYGVSPQDYETADEYMEALNAAKAEENNVSAKEECLAVQKTESDAGPKISISEMLIKGKKYVWRKYCADGSKYGIHPEDYETADEYEEALEEAKRKGQ